MRRVGFQHIYEMVCSGDCFELARCHSRDIVRDELQELLLIVHEVGEVFRKLVES